MPKTSLVIALCLLAAGMAACGTSASGQSAAATVNGHVISMASYQKQFSYKRVVSSDTTGIDLCVPKSTKALCNQIKQSALNKLIQDELVNEYAAKHHITVSDAEFNRQWAVIDAKDFHNQASVLKAYAKRYGWTPDDLKASVREDMLRQKVMFAVTPNLSRYSAAVRISRIDAAPGAELKRVQKALSSGVPFDTLARQLNDDKKSMCRQQNGCGDVGWVPDALLPVNEKQVVYDRVGQVTGPYVSQQFAEFIKLTGRDPHRQMTLQQQYRLREVRFVVWLTKQQQAASISRHVKV